METAITPKTVILAVVTILGVVVLGGLAAATWLASTGTRQPTLIHDATLIALGGVVGILGNTRTTPEIPEVPKVLAQLTEDQAAEVVRRIKGASPDDVLPDGP